MKGLAFGSSSYDGERRESRHGSNRKKTEFDFRVARTMDDMMRVCAIRSIVYVNDQNCPYDEEFDGNDLSGTNLLALDRETGEPCATVRLRFFGDFVKMERLAVRSEYRNSTLTVRFVRYALDHCARKGFQRVYGQPEARLLPFWKRFGFTPLKTERDLVFSDRRYMELVCELEPHPERISLETSPYMLIRPEGEWDNAGILDRSAVREPINA